MFKIAFVNWLLPGRRANICACFASKKSPRSTCPNSRRIAPCAGRRNTRRRASSSPKAKRSRAACSKAASPSSPSCCRKNGWKFRPLLEARPETVTVYRRGKIRCSKPGRLLAVSRRPLGRQNSPAPLTLEEILAKSPKPKLFVAIDGLSNAENLGAVVRNCVAFGVQALLVGETCSSPFLRRSVRNSMGTIFQLPVWEVRTANPVAAAGREMRRPFKPGADAA